MPQLSPTPSLIPSLRAKTPRRLLALSLLMACIGLPACSSEFDKTWDQASVPISSNSSGFHHWKMGRPLVFRRL